LDRNKKTIATAPGSAGEASALAVDKLERSRRSEELTCVMIERYESGTSNPWLRYSSRTTWSVELGAPIHHRGDGEAAGERGGCGGDWGHWRFWDGWGWEVGKFIRKWGV